MTSAVFLAEAAFCEMNPSVVRITEVDVGATVVNNEDEAALKPLVISPVPSGGSRLAWMGSDGKVHVTTLDANDQVGTSFALPANDFSDLYADDNGGVLLMTWDAQEGGTLNCGTPANLCGTAPNPPIPCYDMFINGSYLAKQAVGTTRLTFDFSAGVDPVLTVTIVNTV